MQMLNMPHQSIVRCRTCFKETKSMADILKSQVIKDLIQTHLHISVEQSDLSHFICESCVQTLYQFQTYYQTCHMVQKQICEFGDLMSQFRHTESQNIILDRTSDMNLEPKNSASLQLMNMSTPLPNQSRDYDFTPDYRLSVINHSQNGNSTNHRRRHVVERGPLNDMIADSSGGGKITMRRKSGSGPYEKRGVENIRSKSMAPSKVTPSSKRTIAFKLKNDRTHNMLLLVLMDRSTKENLSFDELSFDELNDVRRCVNDPKVLTKIQEHLRKSNPSDETKNILRSLIKREIF